jgi:hypothetical protein
MNARDPPKVELKPVMVDDARP